MVGGIALARDQQDGGSVSLIWTFRRFPARDLDDAAEFILAVFARRRGHGGGSVCDRHAGRGDKRQSQGFVCGTNVARSD